MELIPAKSEGAVPIKSWAVGVPFEDQARAQVERVASLGSIVGPHVAIMPDVHWGIGATVGSVIPTRGVIIPAAVGVDLGCVDGETEFLTPSGWKRIDTYTNEQVLEYDVETGTAAFKVPEAYIKAPCDKFFAVKTKYGVNQRWSSDHRVLVAVYDRSYAFSRVKVFEAHEVAKRHNSTVLGFRHRFLTTFTPVLTASLPLTDAELRVAVMVAADGYVRNRSTGNIVLRFKKERKIARAKLLLNQAGLIFTEGVTGAGVVTLSFNYVTGAEKSLAWMWSASARQLSVIVDEVFHWDGSAADRVYFTRDKPSADFVQYALTASGFRSVLREDVKNGGVDYRVFAFTNTKVGISGTPKTPIEIVASEDGLKYCFTTSTGFWVMRRGGVIAITGNCGMNAMRLNLKAKDLPDDLSRLRTAIEEAVPHGRSNNGKENDVGAHRHESALLTDSFEDSGLQDVYASILARHPKLNHRAVIRQIGTLGSGNHFIELCLDEAGDVWIMLHSGSRGPGNVIGTYFIEQARQEMARLDVHLPDRDLAYLSEGSKLFYDYVEAAGWAQDYAFTNRRVMMQATHAALEKTLHRKVKVTDEAIQCHHNYVAREYHFGENLWITRKGAVRAGQGDLGIIPGSMGTKSYIVRGKGNPDSFCSCSHGAGRAMSRAKAKETFTLKDHRKATEGVECRKDREVIDETPGAYKGIDEVMAAQTDLVEVVHTLKQVCCIKG